MKDFHLGINIGPTTAASYKVVWAPAVLIPTAPSVECRSTVEAKSFVIWFPAERTQWDPGLATERTIGDAIAQGALLSSSMPAVNSLRPGVANAGRTIIVGLRPVGCRVPYCCPASYRWLFRYRLLWLLRLFGGLLRLLSGRFSVALFCSCRIRRCYRFRVRCGCLGGGGVFSETFRGCSRLHFLSRKQRWCGQGRWANGGLAWSCHAKWTATELPRTEVVVHEDSISKLACDGTIIDAGLWNEIGMIGY